MWAYPKLICNLIVRNEGRDPVVVRLILHGRKLSTIVVLAEAIAVVVIARCLESHARAVGGVAARAIVRAPAD